MPTGSEHVLKDNVKQTKRIKLDNVGKPGKKDVIEGINAQSISEIDFQLEVAEENVTLKKRRKKCKDKNEMDEMIFPQGNPMQLIAGIKFPSSAIGSALQFLEFCSAFEQVCTFLSKQCFWFISMVQIVIFSPWVFSFTLSQLYLWQHQSFLQKHV